MKTTSVTKLLINNDLRLLQKIEQGEVLRDFFNVMAAQNMNVNDDHFRKFMNCVEKMNVAIDLLKQKVGEDYATSI